MPDNDCYRVRCGFAFRFEYLSELIGCIPLRSDYWKAIPGPENPMSVRDIYGWSLFFPDRPQSGQRSIVESFLFEIQLMGDQRDDSLSTLSVPLMDRLARREQGKGRILPSMWWLDDDSLMKSLVRSGWMIFGEPFSPDGTNFNGKRIASVAEVIWLCMNGNEQEPEFPFNGSGPLILTSTEDGLGEFLICLYLSPDRKIGITAIRKETDISRITNLVAIPVLE